MAFTWAESIAAASQINNSNAAEIVDKIAFMETVWAIPPASQFTFPAGEEPFAQTGQNIKASNMSNMVSAIDKIDDYRLTMPTLGAYCTTVNTAYNGSINSTHLSAYYSVHKGAYNVTVYLSHFITYDSSYNVAKAG